MFPPYQRADHVVQRALDADRRWATVAVVDADAEAPGVNTRETADWETPAARATSCEVTLGLGISRPSNLRQSSWQCR